jgi:hypothetical protein
MQMQDLQAGLKNISLDRCQQERYAGEDFNTSLGRRISCVAHLEPASAVCKGFAATGRNRSKLMKITTCGRAVFLCVVSAAYGFAQGATS